MTSLYRRMKDQLGADYTIQVYRLANTVVGKIMRADWSTGSRTRLRRDEPDLLDDVVGLIVAHDRGDLGEAAHKAGKEKTAELYPAYSRHSTQRGPAPLDAATASLGRWGKVKLVDPQVDHGDDEERDGWRDDRMPLSFAFVYPEHDLTAGGAVGRADPSMRQALAVAYEAASDLARRRIDMFAAGLTTTQVAAADGCTRQAARDSLKRFAAQVQTAHGLLADRS